MTCKSTVRLSLCLKREDGNNLVEYAITLIFYLMLLFGILDFGRALYTYHFVSNAAREAARWAAVNGATCGDDSSCNGTAPMNSGPASPTDIQNYVTNITPQGIDRTRISTNSQWLAPAGSPATCAGTPNGPGCTVQVTVTYPFNFLVPLVHTGSVDLSSTSEMVIAH